MGNDSYMLQSVNDLKAQVNVIRRSVLKCI